MSLQISRRLFLLSPAIAAVVPAAGGDFIDAHVHVWTPDTNRYPLAAGFQRENMKPASFTPEQLMAHAKPSGVARVVLIQMSFYGYDNSYMLDTIAAYAAAGVFRGIAVIDHEVANPRPEMDRLKQGGVRGFRLRGQTAAEWPGHAGMNAMWKHGAETGLAMCPLINPDALPVIDRMCRTFPETTVVIDHMARVGTSGKIAEPDLRALCDLAKHPKVYVKVSAFYAHGRKQAPYTDLLPTIKRLIGAYGVRRLMWASDSPFQVDAPHTYEASVALIRDRLTGISAEDRQWLLKKTAESVFFSTQKIAI